MAFNKDTAFKASQQAALNRKLKQAEQGVATLKQEVKEVRQEQAAIRNSDVTRYYIRTPLADAEDEAKAGAIKLEIQIPAGPTAHKDADGKQIIREMGQVILLEGEGVTTDPLWAEYIRWSFPEWDVSEIRPAGLASYLEEIEEAKAALIAQGG